MFLKKFFSLWYKIIKEGTPKKIKIIAGIIVQITSRIENSKMKNLKNLLEIKLIIRSPTITKINNKKIIT
jgi:hypothetical protein